METPIEIPNIISSPYIKLDSKEYKLRQSNKTLVWENVPREDLHMIPFMTKMGWDVNYEYADRMYDRLYPHNVPHNAVWFRKENLDVWKVSNWKLAIRENDKIVTRVNFDSLLELLNWYLHAYK
jgi:hypothetical protein